MKKIFIFVFLFLISMQGINSSEFFSKTGELIELDFCQIEDLKECEEIFITAFSKAYENFNSEQLGVKDKLAFLKEAFADVYDELSLDMQKLIVARQGDKIIGFVGFKQTEKAGEVYISQLAVDPNYWQQGIGRHLVFSAKEYFNELKSLVVIPRKINIIARNFYLKLKFVESSYMHPGYNPERYIGYEWTLPAESTQEN